ncbi:conserved hypothetical protein [Desulfatibacillum aliphaticivorans]|uniref:Uncharacterized protein n=1 Tax=Desulfatibacillum aliphaticivorans TaxID=218208 RepID=B8FA27_DESAL|nr:DUF6210 family protein [Desulfatibacillum aliphaticivorans]ACL03123.1 conserved hypothetical protein [Desulfatibacillum aliphaticivorans]
MTKKAQMPTLRLCDIGERIGLIIVWKSGVVYSNQTGGLACFLSKQEGVFVPIGEGLLNQDELLWEHFTGSKWFGACMDGIDEETADYIDEVLEQNIETSCVKVDRSRLGKSHEAWIYVTIADDPNSEERRIIKGFDGCRAVLTWDNSELP